MKGKLESSQGQLMGCREGGQDGQGDTHLPLVCQSTQRKNEQKPQKLTLCPGFHIQIYTAADSALSGCCPREASLKELPQPEFVCPVDCFLQAVSGYVPLESGISLTFCHISHIQDQHPYR